MNKLIHVLVISLMLLGFSGYSSAKTVKKIDSYGVYVVAKKGYLRDFPNGYKAKEAKERKEFAQKKIKEYEPLL